MLHIYIKKAEMDRFHFFEKRSFRSENDDEKTKTSFLFTIVNNHSSLTIVKDDPKLTIFNEDPSLTIVNDAPLLTKRGGEKINRPEGHRYLSLSSFKENIKKF